MTNKITFLLIGILLFQISCKTETTENIIKTNKQLANNKLLEVVKTEITDTKIGIITNHKYATTYRFNYQFTVNNNEVIWKNNGSAVPKAIVFCNDSVYLKYIQKKRIPYKKILNDTLNITEYKDTIVQLHDKFIDKRYFFKWFGKASWVSVSKELYNTKKTICKEDSIPNDADLKNYKSPLKNYVNYEILNDTIIYHDVFHNGINWYKAEDVKFKVKDADAKTFKELSDKYAKDSLHIFFKGHRLRKRDIHTFKVLNSSITTDKYGVYHNNKIIRGSHGLSFKFTDDNYAIDNNQMYFFGTNYYSRLKGVDKKSAKILDCETCSYYYVMDKKHVFWQGNLIQNVNIKSFKVINKSFSKDDKNIFYLYTHIKEADHNSFRILKNTQREGSTTFYAEDKNNLYGTNIHNLELIIKKKA